MAMVMGTYVVFTFWQFRYSCVGGDSDNLLGCYTVRDPLDIAVICAAAMGACAEAPNGQPPRRRADAGSARRTWRR